MCPLVTLREETLPTDEFAREPAVIILGAFEKTSFLVIITSYAYYIGFQLGCRNDCAVTLFNTAWLNMTFPPYTNIQTANVQVQKLHQATKTHSVMTTIQ